MDSERARVLGQRERSRDRVRRTTLVLGATAAVTGGVLAVGLAGGARPALTPTSSGPVTTPVARHDDGGDGVSDDDGGFANTPQPAPAPVSVQHSGSVSTSGGS